MASHHLLKMYAEEFEEIKDVVKDFRFANELFKKKSSAKQYPTPGMSNSSNEIFARLMSFLVASKWGNIQSTDQLLQITQEDEKASVNGSQTDSKSLLLNFNTQHEKDPFHPSQKGLTGMAENELNKMESTMWLENERRKLAWIFEM